MIDFLNFNYVDLIILILLLITSIIGLNNGFIKEFINFLIWTLSILFSFLIMNKLIFLNLVNPNIIFSMIIFFILFLLNFIVLKLLIHYFISDMKNIFSSHYINNIFGLIFGFTKGLFLILLSTSGVIYLFYTTRDLPIFFKNSLLFETITIYAIKIIEKIANFI